MHNKESMIKLYEFIQINKNIADIDILKDIFLTFAENKRRILYITISLNVVNICKELGFIVKDYIFGGYQISSRI